MRFSTHISLFLTTALLGGVLHAAPPTEEEMSRYVENRPQLDLITWQDESRGDPFTVRFISSDGENITVEKTLAAGLATRILPLDEIAEISFTFTIGEKNIHRQAAASHTDELRVYWETRKGTISLPGSNVGETGLILAKSLRLSNSPEAAAESLEILSEILRSETPQTIKDRAKAEQLTISFLSAVKSGDLPEADRLAWDITAGPENDEGMLIATAFLGDRHFEELKAVQEEHPRWMDDDEIRPLYKRLYNLSLDFFIYPSLFNGTRKVEASTGLRRAAEVYRFTGSNELTKTTLEDLAALYPDSEAAKETAGELETLREREKKGKLAKTKEEQAAEEQAKAEAEEEKTEEADPEPTSPPPPPKRYNIFTD